MDEVDFENLTSIIHDSVVKHKYDAPTNDSLTKPEIDWHVKHGEYVEKEILKKIIAGATITHKA
jgi:hypothetical protein